MAKLAQLSTGWRAFLVTGIILVVAVAGFLGYNAWQRQITQAGKESTLGKQINGSMDINNVSVQLGPEEYMAGPVGFSDSAYFTERDLRGRMHGFMANQTSYVFRLNDKGKPVIPKTKAGLKRQVILSRDKRPADGAPKRAVFDREEARGLHPDRCGAWMLSAIRKNPKNKEHWFGWYHGEDQCNYDNGGQTHMTLAYVESKNAGKTWRKVGYPNNRIITADKALRRDHKTDDTGGGRAMVIGNFFYMFFRATGEVKRTDKNGVATTSYVNDRIHIARSKISDFGKPNTWWKWYCGDSGRRETCGYTEPGIGGRSTPISTKAGASATADNLPAPMRFISYNRYLNRYITMQASGKGFELRASDGKDFLTWKKKNETLYPPVTIDTDFTVQNWNYGGDPDKCRKKDANGNNVETNFECKQLYAYTSIGGKEGGDKNTDREFYLYYTKIYPGEEHSQRYLLRRTVKLSAPSNGGKPSNVTQARTTRVQLAVYVNKQGDRRITSELPHPKSGYRLESNLGYILSAAATGYQPLFECQRPTGKFYTKRVVTNAAYGLPNGGNPPTRCSSTDKLIRRVGWISPIQTSEASVPIYANSQAFTRQGTPIGYGLPELK